MWRRLGLPAVSTSNEAKARTPTPRMSSTAWMTRAAAAPAKIAPHAARFRRKVRRSSGTTATPSESAEGLLEDALHPQSPRRCGGGFSQINGMAIRGFASAVCSHLASGWPEPPGSKTALVECQRTRLAPYPALWPVSKLMPERDPRYTRPSTGKLRDHASDQEPLRPRRRAGRHRANGAADRRRRSVGTRRGPGGAGKLRRSRRQAAAGGGQHLDHPDIGRPRGARRRPGNPMFPPGSPFEEFFRDFLNRNRPGQGGGGGGTTSRGRSGGRRRSARASSSIRRASW